MKSIRTLNSLLVISLLISCNKDDTTLTAVQETQIVNVTSLFEQYGLSKTSEKIFELELNDKIYSEFKLDMKNRIIERTGKYKYPIYFSLIETLDKNNLINTFLVKFKCTDEKKHQSFSFLDIGKKTGKVEVFDMSGNTINELLYEKGKINYLVDKEILNVHEHLVSRNPSPCLPTISGGDGQTTGGAQWIDQFITVITTTIIDWYQENPLTGELEYLDESIVSVTEEVRTIQVLAYLNSDYELVPCETGQGHDRRYLEFRFVEIIISDKDLEEGLILKIPCDLVRTTGDIGHQKIEEMPDGEINYDNLEQEVEEDPEVVDVSSLYSFDYPCTDEQTGDIISSIMEELNASGNCSQDAFDTAIAEFKSMENYIYNEFKDCLEDEDLCNMLNGDPIDWLNSSDQDKIDIFLNNFRYLSIQNKCTDNYNTFSPASFFENSTAWTDGNAFQGDACTNTYNSSIEMSFNGGASCNDCIALPPCPQRLLPNGKSVIELRSCTSTGCGQVQPCVSFYVDENIAAEFYEQFFGLDWLNCPE